MSGGEIQVRSPASDGVLEGKQTLLKEREREVSASTKQELLSSEPSQHRYYAIVYVGSA
jgi:hypothetical protein